MIYTIKLMFSLFCFSFFFFEHRISISYRYPPRLATLIVGNLYCKSVYICNKIVVIKYVLRVSSKSCPSLSMLSFLPDINIVSESEFITDKYEINVSLNN